MVENAFMKNISSFQPKLDEVPSISCPDKVRAIQEISSVFTYNRFH